MKTTPTSFKNIGFTLLELLLVILILAALASFGLSTLKQYADNVRVHRTAEQIQQILQAAASYHVDTGTWPTACNDPNFTSYLSVGLTNTYGSKFVCQTEGNGNKFGVLSGNLPDAGIAKQLAALLSSAQLIPANSPNPNQVLSEIVVPANKTAPVIKFKYLIRRISQSSNLVNGSAVSLPLFSCPKNTIGRTMVTIQSIMPDNWYYASLQFCSGYGWGSKTINILQTTNDGFASCNPVGQPDGQGNLQYSCNYTVLNQSLYQDPQATMGHGCSFYTTNSGNVVFAFISYCCIPGEPGC